MRSLKFNILTICFLITTGANASFTDMECIKSKFSTSVIHKTWPFGLLSKTLGIEKKECLLTISHNSYKFLNKKWEIDICRGPVHLKSVEGSVDVLKRKHDCSKKTSSGYCKALIKIEGVIQDDGLIFAKGEKEDLNTDHGRINCSNLLVRKYLRDGMIINRGQEYDGLLQGGKKILKSVTPTEETEFTESSNLNSF